MLPFAIRPLSLGNALGRVFSRVFSSASIQRMPQTSWTTGKYPQARRSDHVDIYQSTSRGQVSIPDPYQWLENDSEETDNWTTAQEAFTREYLDKNPDLDRLTDAFRDSVDYPKVLGAASAVHLNSDSSLLVQRTLFIRR